MEPQKIIVPKSSECNEKMNGVLQKVPPGYKLVKESDWFEEIRENWIRERNRHKTQHHKLVADKLLDAAPLDNMEPIQ